MLVLGADIRFYAGYPDQWSSILTGAGQRITGSQREGGVFILIPIPAGVSRVATVRGAVWKVVPCSHCKERYAYLLELEATGEDHDQQVVGGKDSAERARARRGATFKDEPQCGAPGPVPQLRGLPR